MNKITQEFSDNLYKFLNDLYKFTKNNSVKKIIDIFKNLHTIKTAKKFIEATGKYSQSIENKDDTIFMNKFIILPGIDMNKLWNSMDTTHKNKIWLHLEILIISANMLLQETNTSTYSTNDTNITINNRDLDTDTHSTLNNFNPYVGVGSDDCNFGTDDLFGGPEQLPGDKNNSSFDMSQFNLTNMIDINKFVNIKEIKQQLEKITDEDIDLAFEKIKNEVEDTNYDHETATYIANLLKDITKELKNIDTDKNLQINDIITIFESIVSKITPKLKEGKFDIKNLWKIANSLTLKYIPQGDNNFKIITSFMQQQFSMFDNITDSNNNVNFTKEHQDAYIHQCNDILKDIGIQNFDLNNIDTSAILQNLSSCVNSTGNLNINNIQKIIGGFDISNIQNIMGQFINTTQHSNTHTHKHKHIKNKKK